MREDFSEFDIPTELIEAFPPDPSALLPMLCGMMTDDMLLEIASCNYGNDIEANLAGLRQIISQREVPDPMPWHPQEVLSLKSWSEPVDERSHMVRAFCCACILRPRPLEEWPGTDGDKFVNLLESALFIGGELHAPILGAAVYALTQLRPWDEEFPAIAFAFVTVVILTKLMPPVEDLPERAAEWLVTIDQAAMKWHLDNIAYMPDPSPKSFTQVIRLIQCEPIRNLARRLESLTAILKLKYLAGRIADHPCLEY